jgi:hypothetical protein
MQDLFFQIALVVTAKRGVTIWSTGQTFPITCQPIQGWWKFKKTGYFD